MAWPQLNQVGDVGLGQLTPHDNWRCIYYTMRNSLIRQPNRVQWVERCFHGHTRHIDSTLIVAGSNSPIKRVVYFDPDGKITHISGSDKELPSWKASNTNVNNP
jgi:hypothetical protein